MEHGTSQQRNDSQLNYSGKLHFYHLGEKELMLGKREQRKEWVNDG